MQMRADETRSQAVGSTISADRVCATDLSTAALEMLWEDREFVLSRVVRGEQLPPLLAMAPASSWPAAETVARLERAYALRDELDPAWAARPLALIRSGGRA